MINWHQTQLKFGYSNSTDLKKKRPIVVCQCDTCGKQRDITIRVKSKIVDGQIPWLCSSCVCLGRSSTISESMKNKWKSSEYKENQLTIKQQHDYKIDQSAKSVERWQNEDYRKKLETGIDIQSYLEKCQVFGPEFEYDTSSFINWKTKITITCTKCRISFTRLPQLHLDCGTCPCCKIPTELIQLAPNPIINDRTTINPLELDIFWPQHKFAIEYHGLYWHSYDTQESKRDIMRHQDKAIKCSNLSIKLVQIFDFEWKTKKELISSMFKHMLQKSTKMHARNLDVKTITNYTAAPFFNENHMQGHRNAKYNLALYDGNTIMMVMSFSKHNDGFEVIRMATKIGYHVNGGASKLLKHFTNAHRSPIYTFADLRHSTGNVYKKIGFTSIKTTKPGYFYYKGKTILSRQRCQKHKLRELLGQGFNSEWSESENMFKNGYRRVWDAGHIKLVFKPI